MKLSSPQKEAKFVQRLNRFAALVDMGGETAKVHVANSGRLSELLQRGCRVHLVDRPSLTRQTAYDLCLVDVGHTLVSADARLPNPLTVEAISQGQMPQFLGFSSLKREVRYGESRLDLQLLYPDVTCYLECKSVTLVVGGAGLFPDAPTSRGRRHLETLMRARREGHRAAVIFVIQREDAESFKPNDAADPSFGQTLRRAAAEGVEVYAYRCRVRTDEICISERLPVHL